MLEIPDETLGKVLAALMRMDLGEVAHRTVEAALHLLRERYFKHERERREEVNWECPVMWE